MTLVGGLVAFCLLAAPLTPEAQPAGTWTGSSGAPGPPTCPEQPVKPGPVINRKTVRTLGLTISPTMRARADQVIE